MLAGAVVLAGILVKSIYYSSLGAVDYASTCYASPGESRILADGSSYRVYELNPWANGKVGTLVLQFGTSVGAILVDSSLQKRSKRGVWAMRLGFGLFKGYLVVRNIRVGRKLRGW